MEVEIFIVPSSFKDCSGKINNDFRYNFWIEPSSPCIFLRNLRIMLLVVSFD